MAFMVPVMKKDYDIYKTNRSRRVSETAVPARSRKISECKSEAPGGGSLSTSASSNLKSPKHRSVPANMSRQYSSTSTSENSSQSRNGTTSTTPKNQSEQSLKFHIRLFDKLKKSSRSSKNGKDSERTSS